MFRKLKVSQILLIFSLVFTLCLFRESKAQQTNKLIPANIPQIEIVTNTNPSEDYLFLGLTEGDYGHLMIIDNDAVPVFYKRVDGIIFNFLWQENGELTYNIYPDSSYGLDSSGNLVNRFYVPDSLSFDFHELTVIADGSYYVLSDENVVVDLSGIVPGGSTHANLISQNIHHMDVNDNEIWKWRSFDHYDILDADSAVNLTQGTIDWTHCNSIKVDYDGNLLLSTRNFNEITKINRQTGDIIWRFGGERNQFQFINDDRRFARQHDAKRNAAGNLIMFDNGVRLVPQYSSLVEYELDEDSLTATLIRRFTRDESVWSRIRGGVQGLSNGNHLICWGERPNPGVTEINPDNEIVYEINFPGGGHRYRSFRFPWETNYFDVDKDSIEFGIVEIGDSSTIPVNLINRNNQQVIINEILNKDSAFQINENLPIILPPNDTITTSVTFKPYSNEYKKDKINYRYNVDTLIIAQQVYVEGYTSLTSAEEEGQYPDEFLLAQNYPNPFNPITNIGFQIADRGFVILKIFDILGNEVATLVNEELSAGNYEVEFSVAQINNLSSGIYFYQLKAGKFIQSKKMILLK